MNTDRDIAHPPITVKGCGQKLAFMITNQVVWSDVSHHLQEGRKCQLQQLMLQQLCELHPPVVVSAPP